MTALSWQRSLHNSMKLWAMTCRATQDGRVIVKNSDRMQFPGEGSGKPLQYSCCKNPRNSMRVKNMWHQKMSPSSGRSSICYWRRSDSSKKNKVIMPKQKWCSVVDMSGGESKVQRCKEQYCIGTWNVRSMSKSKLDVVKQEMARVNIDILGISELKWTGKDKI